MAGEATAGLGFVNMVARRSGGIVVFGMSDSARFTDDEARRVLARAAELSVPAPGAREGVVALPDLMRIGEEAGLSREAVARAALEVTYGADRAAVRRTFARLPHTVTRTAVGDAGITDAAWAEMVRTCRTMFEADGEVLESPGLRIWRNGNLRVQLEAVPGGTRLSLSTRKDAAGWTALVGISWFGAFAGLGALFVAMGEPTAKAVGFTMLALPGLGGIVWEYARLSRWAKARAAQFDALAAQLPRLLHRPDGEDR